MQKITPHLWFDTQARQAAEFYTSVFPDSSIHGGAVLPNTPSGDAETVSFTLAGQDFMAISAGPHFTLNPSISFILNFDPSRVDDAEQALRRTWEALSEGGQALVPLGTYPFSPLFGWVQDRFGVCWVLMLGDLAGEDRPFLIPQLMFVGDVCGKAEEATDFYLGVFGEARRGVLSHYPEGQEPDQPGTVNFTDFQLEDQWFAAMDSAQPHQFGFNEAVSLMVACDSQEEIDRYWEALSAVPEAEQCGWLKDKYGVSWQIVPRRMSEMMMNGSPAQIERVTRAFLPMRKLDLQALEDAYAEAD